MKNKKKFKKKNRWIYRVVICIALIYGIIIKNSNLDIQNKISIASKKSLTSDMEVHFIDVGQADSILVESAGKYMLIDAGNNEDGEKVKSYLQKEGVKELEYVIATHPHEDHIGGMDDIINSFQVDTIFMPDVAHTTKTFTDVLNAIADNNLDITVPKVGEQYTIGNAEFIIIAPNRSEYGDNLNNYSIGIKLVNGKNSFLMCGDVQEEAENDILNNGIDISADVYKVSHHGSGTGTTQEFLQAISPSYAVIQCGIDNEYGHPHQATLDKFNALNIMVYRTDKNGTIVAVSDGEDIRWTCEKK
ncbi:MAG: ComEC/Rec2 family competence protein [Lachnotalea sp.]